MVTVGDQISSLESPARFIDVCTVQEHRSPPTEVPAALPMKVPVSAAYLKEYPKLSNRYDALSEESEEGRFLRPRMAVWGAKKTRVGSLRKEEEVAVRGDPKPSGMSVGGDPFLKPPQEISNVERSVDKEVPLNAVAEDQFIDLTIDSGAGENVMPEHIAPKTPTQYSSEQAAGVVYTAANGETMPNKGKKVLQVITREGQRKAMNMQVTDVHKPLMSVAKICDAGHTVVFKPDGGYIHNTHTGEHTHFRRENNVYRLTVKLHEADFVRQG